MAPDTRPAPAARLVALDLLRLLAVTLVIGRHMWMPPDSWPAAARTVFALWNRGGWIGVDLFFVLSGFLVSGLLFTEFQRHGRISPLRFYARRAWKIYPAHFVMVATTVAVILAQGGEFERIQLVAEVLFFQNYEPGLWIHTWSLAVEEHFYLLLPLVFLLAIHARRRKPSLRLLLVIGAILAAGSLALRVATAADIPAYHPFTHTFPTHLRLDSLFFGVMLAYAYNVHRRRFVQLLAPWRAPLILGGLLLLSPAFLLTLETSPIVYTVGYTMLYLGSGMLLAGAVLCDVPRGPVVGRLATLGALSYSIYLWHMPVFRLGVPLLEQLVGAPFAFGVRVLLYLGGSLAVGVTMARLVELPALAARDRRVPSRARLAAGTRMPRTLETPVGSAAIV